ncbi:MAG TPA: MFS transporter [Solirubrobacterales bacterium]|nr:MFS transporter [Solirubrobacterales bacterium]
MIPSTYRRVLSIRPVRLPLAGATIGRLPFAAEALTLLLLVQGATGSFADAGLVNACYSLGAAAGLPTQGRIVDRVGQTRVIAIATAINALALIGLVVLAEDGASMPAMGAVAVFAGFAIPPLGTSIRTLWSELVSDHELRQSAFALDAVTVEVAFIVGPLLAALVIAIASPAAGVLMNVALSILGSTLFAVSRASRNWRGQPHGLGLMGPLRSGGVLTLMGVGLGLGVAVGAVELGMTAVAADDGVRELGGALLATQAAGSLIGGLVYGSRTWRTPGSRRLGLLSVALALTTVPLVATPSLAATFPLALLSGFTLAPTVSVLYLLLDSVAPTGTATEATGWVLTSFVAGASAGAGLAGAAVHASGPHAGLAVGLAGTVLAAAVAWLWQSQIAQIPALEAAPAAGSGEQPFARVHSK